MTSTGAALPEPPPLPVPLVPGVIVHRLLGAGRRGQVWLATDPGSCERVAVRIGHPRPGSAAAIGPARDLAREIGALVRIDLPALVRLRRVIDLRDGRRAMVLDHVPGGNLATLVARRGGLDAAEVSTVIRALALTLAELHRRGVVHGDLAPGSVLFDVEGRPRIADLGAVRVLGLAPRRERHAASAPDPGPGGPVSDVVALGELIRFTVLGRPSPSGAGQDGGDGLSPGRRALLELAAACLATGDGDRPEPGEVAEQVRRIAPPAPLRLLAAARPDRAWDPRLAVPPELSPAPEVATELGAAALTARIRGVAPRATISGVGASHPAAVSSGATGGRGSGRPGRQRWRRRVAPLGGWPAVGTVAAAAGLGAAVLPVPWPGSSPVGASPVGASPVGAGSAVGNADPRRARSEGADSAQAELERVVRELAAGRAAALAELAPERLRAVDRPGSPALAADTALIRRLREAGVRLDGVAFRIRVLGVAAPGPDRRTVVVGSTTSAHRRVEVGRPPRVVPAGAERRLTLDLVRTPSAPGVAAGPWQVAEVR